MAGERGLQRLDARSEATGGTEPDLCFCLFKELDGWAELRGVYRNLVGLHSRRSGQLEQFEAALGKTQQRGQCRMTTGQFGKGCGKDFFALTQLVQ